jgi:hypothetical protein
MTTVRVGEVWFRVVDLRADGSVTLADRADAACRVTRAEVRKVLAAAASAFDRLAAAWEAMHHG